MIKKTHCITCGTSLDVEIIELDDFGFAEGLLKTGIMCDDCKDKVVEIENPDWFHSRLRDAGLIIDGRPHPFIDFDNSKGNALLKKWVWANRNNSLYINDCSGSCKTRVCVAAASHLCKSERVEYIKAKILQEDLQGLASESTSKLNEYLYRIKERDLLIIDDFGKEGATSFVAKQVHDIIDDRYERGRKTWITSEYGFKTIHDKYNKTDDKYGEGITRRISEYYLNWGEFKNKCEAV